MKLKSLMAIAIAATSLLLISCAYAIEGTPRHMVFASDPQYPWTDKTDTDEPEADNVYEVRAKWFIEAQFASISEFRNNMGGLAQVPLMINGDMTHFGHGWQRAYLNTALKRHFGDDYLYGLGNHDYENNVDDCFSNNCAAGSIVEFKEHHEKKVDNFDLKISGWFLDKLYTGSLAYSKNVGEVHLVQLNNEPTYTRHIADPLNPTTFAITDALDWLEYDLSVARTQGYAIILNMHKPYNWGDDPKQYQRFVDMIKKYQVTAIFGGHFHFDGGEMRRVGDVPVFVSGSASQQTYLTATFSEDRKQLHVSLVRNNDWRNRKLIETVPVKSIFANRP